jgi:hypothetical protein
VPGRSVRAGAGPPAEGREARRGHRERAPKRVPANIASTGPLSGST